MYLYTCQWWHWSFLKLLFQTTIINQFKFTQQFPNEIFSNLFYKQLSEVIWSLLYEITEMGVPLMSSVPPPPPRLCRARTRACWPTCAWERQTHTVHGRWSRAESSKESIAISKLNFKDIYFKIFLNGNFLRLMFAYTTSDVYLTLRFKFWNLCIKFSWN
jgi:hypothetical protein